MMEYINDGRYVDTPFTASNTAHALQLASITSTQKLGKLQEHFVHVHTSLHIHLNEHVNEVTMTILQEAKENASVTSLVSTSSHCVCLWSMHAI